MSLIDLASLVLAPTATKEGKVYSAIPDTGDGDMTFTRGSSATRVNSDGLIEKERGNLLLQSNTFNTTWSVIRSSVTSGASDPFGGSNAWSFLTDTTADDQHYIYQVISQSGVGTLSIYAKANGYNWLRLRLPSEEAFFDLANGVTGSSTTGISASITDVGSGWYRCEVAISDMSSNPNVFIHIAEGDGDVVINGTPSGTDGLYIYAAQLNQGLVAQSYIETTTSAVYEGITDDAPRVDYSGGGCPSLLLEPQRTNLLVQSEAFSTSAWTDNRINANVTANATISPEGVQNASEIEFTTTSSEIYDQFTNVASSLHIGSIFVKNKDINSIKFEVVGGAPSIEARVIINLQNGTLSNQVGDYTPTIEDYGNGWYRVAIGDTGTATIATPSFRLEADGTNTGSFYVYGAMVEAGSYVSSYTPTYGTSTSRSADSCSLTNASNLIGQSEGTIYTEVKFSKLAGLVPREWFIISDGTTSATTDWLTVSTSGAGNNLLRARIAQAGVIKFDQQYTIPTTGTYKMAFAYKSTDCALYVNGVSVGTVVVNAAFTLSLDQIISSFTSGTFELGDGLNQAILFPTRLTNDQLAELTK